MQFSYWEKQSFIQSPDLVVIGSGIVGLFSAIFFKQTAPNLKVLILERGMLPYGASTRNAGFACFGSPSELLEDLRSHSESEVFSLVEKRWNGLKLLRETLGDQHIRYEPFGGHEIFTANDEPLFDECLSILPTLNKNLRTISGVSETYSESKSLIQNFGFRNISRMILNKSEGQIDTGRMMKSLLELARANDITILNGVQVEQIAEDENQVEILINNSSNPNKEESTAITAKKLLICTNGFARQFLPLEDIEPARSQVLITSPVEGLQIKGSFHYDRGYYYFRNVGDRILFGGGRNIDFTNEYTFEFGITDKIQSRLETLLSTIILPGSKYTIDMRWSGIMGLGKMKSPIVKKSGKNIFCAVRMGGMGIALGSLTGKETAKLILDHL